MVKPWRHDESNKDTLLEEAILAYFKAEDANEALDIQTWLNEYPPSLRPAMQSFLTKHRAARQICQAGLWVSPVDDDAGFRQMSPHSLTAGCAPSPATAAQAGGLLTKRRVGLLAAIAVLLTVLAIALGR